MNFYGKLIRNEFLCETINMGPKKFEPKTPWYVQKQQPFLPLYHLSSCDMCSKQNLNILTFPTNQKKKPRAPNGRTQHPDANPSVLSPDKKSCDFGAVPFAIAREEEGLWPTLVQEDGLKNPLKRHRCYRE